jgi:signal peptidase I
MFVVRSDSMQPVFGAGDMVVIVPPGFLGHRVLPGEIVSYKLSGNTITHRVVKVDGASITTKGDANDEADGAPVALSQVVGVYLMEIPHIGYFTAFIRTRPGWFLSIVLPALVLVGWLVIDIIREALNLEKEPVNEPDYSTFIREKSNNDVSPVRLVRFLAAIVKGPGRHTTMPPTAKSSLKKAGVQR